MKKQFLFIFLFVLLLGINFVFIQRVQASGYCEGFCEAHQDSLNYDTCLDYCENTARSQCTDECSGADPYEGCVSTCLANEMQSYLDQGGNTGELVIENPLGPTSDIWQLIMKIIDFVFNIAVLVTAIIVVYAGYLYITSTGEPKKIQTAQKVLIWALIGFALVLIAKSIPPFIYNFLTGKNLNVQSEGSSYSSYSASIQYPTSPVLGGYVYNSATGECVWDDNATGDSSECVDDLIL